ncbi:hypothetical protein HRbin36_01041 [bacterium HR36]|nr:hypothetical protein HRbin36_01041 [bacterium HR36]
MIADSARFYPITHKVRQVDFHGSFTAASGHLVYTARTYPKFYWNRVAFVADPTGHLVASLILERQGSSYRSRYGWNLLASDDEWSAPIAAAVGPDGNVWVIDWYSYIVQHNPTPPGFRTGRGNAYETPLRDTKHGRIYRLVQRGTKPGSYPRLLSSQPQTLLRGLQHDNLFWRLHSQRLIVENRCSQLIPDLVALLHDDRVDECDLNVASIHALWSLHGLGALQGNWDELKPSIKKAFHHRSYAVRQNAVRVLPSDSRGAQCLAESAVLRDADPAVQKAVLLRIAEMPTNPCLTKHLVDVLGEATWNQDRPLLHAYTVAAAVHIQQWLEFLPSAGKRDLGDSWRAVVQRIAEHGARSNDVSNLRALLNVLDKLDSNLQQAILEGWIQGTPNEVRGPLLHADEKRLGLLLTQLPEPSTRLLTMLALRWKSEIAGEHAGKLKAVLERDLVNTQLNQEMRLRAAHQLAELFPDSREVAQLLLRQMRPQAPPDLVTKLASVIVKMSAAGILEDAVQTYGSLTPAGRKALLNQLFTREDWLMDLLHLTARGALSASDLSLEQRQTLLQHRNQRIAIQARKVLETAGGLPNPDRQKVVESFKETAQRRGDAEAGRKVFQTHCAKCHSYRGEGGKVGPDLTGMAIHSKEHLLVEILDPSRSVEGNYRQYLVATKSGLAISGILVAESRTTIEVLDAEGKTHVIPREHIEEIQASPKSLMPDGFEQQLKPQELADLLEFLTHREKYLPLPLDRVATAVSTQGMFYRHEATQERLVFSDWKPKSYKGIPFHLVDPQGGRVPNVVLFYSPQGTYPPKMPKSVELPCNLRVRALHMLSGVSGWGYPLGKKGTVSLVVRLHYDNGQSEEHLLRNGEHFADYIRRVDVPGSEFAFALGQQQIRYLAIQPKRPQDIIRKIEFIKGPDETAPIIMAVTLELSDLPE